MLHSFRVRTKSSTRGGDITWVSRTVPLSRGEKGKGGWGKCKNKNEVTAPPPPPHPRPRDRAGVTANPPTRAAAGSRREAEAGVEPAADRRVAGGVPPPGEAEPAHRPSGEQPGRPPGEEPAAVAGAGK